VRLRPNRGSRVYPALRRHLRMATLGSPNQESRMTASPTMILSLATVTFPDYFGCYCPVS
jgi:hypothetical protein